MFAWRTTATGGRDGKVRTDDGTFEVTLAAPKELGGNGQGNNPEQLFAAGYAACFLSALKFVGTQGKHARLPADASVSATVGIGPRANKGFGLAVTLDIALPGLDAGDAEALVAEADAGLAGGKRVLVALARGGHYAEGPAVAMEHAETHLRAMLGFIGITQPEFVIAEGVALGPDQREAAIAAALGEVAALPSGLAPGLKPSD